MLEDTNSLDAAHFTSADFRILLYWLNIWATSRENLSSGVCDQVWLKPSCAAAETSKSLEISDVETRGSILSTAKILNIRTPKKFAVITLKFKQHGFTEE